MTVSFKQPVIIVGAPRSGTSLMQTILREYPGFASAPKESQAIWKQYTHPSLHGWESETVSGDMLSPETRQDILKAFNNQALSARFWRAWSGSGFMTYPPIARLLRSINNHAGKTTALLSGYFPNTDNTSQRLVDKSVHSGLWLELVEYIFPDALYIYIQRDGRETVRSMICGWLDPDRFFTYRPPVALDIPDYPYREWNFALPPGWRDYTNRPLVEVVAYQWSTLHNCIMNKLSHAYQEHRVINIKLEQLVENPHHALNQVTEHIGLPWNDYWQSRANNLPVVNAGNHKHMKVSYTIQNAMNNIIPHIETVQRKLGYPVNNF